eukprot:9019775-Lingulodinium_polyedra.AAC.1
MASQPTFAGSGSARGSAEGHASGERVRGSGPWSWFAQEPPPEGRAVYSVFPATFSPPVAALPP